MKFVDPCGYHGHVHMSAQAASITGYVVNIMCIDVCCCEDDIRRAQQIFTFSMTQLKVDRFLFSHKEYLIIWFVSEACKVVYT